VEYLTETALIALGCYTNMQHPVHQWHRCGQLLLSLRSCSMMQHHYVSALKTLFSNIIDEVLLAN
jgi:hypothetical protein